MKYFALILITFFPLCWIINGRNEPFIRLNKLFCECLNRTYCKFEKCQLKPVRRNVAQVSVNVSLFQTPIRNVKINIDMYRKYTQFGSFPINYTVDGCKFIKNTKKLFLLDAIYKLLENKSNVNHACPYTESYVYAVNITAPYSPIFGFVPTGSYLAKSRWMVDNEIKANLYIWFDMNNPKNTF